MAKKKKSEMTTNIDENGTIEEIIKDLAKEINTSQGEKVAFVLGNQESPTEFTTWTSTGSLLLDYAISNKRNGGIPAGRIIEISGTPSSGKSLLAFEILKNAQRRGDIAVLLDAENSTSAELLQFLGLDSGKLLHMSPKNLEQMFMMLEDIIKKVHLLKKDGKDISVTAVVDSLAALPPKGELDGEYDDNSIGLGARKVSQAMRKITQMTGVEKVTLIIINQLRQKIGILYGDPNVCPYGSAIPFHSTVRLRLSSHGNVEDDDKNIVGIETMCKVIKNKCSIPFRKAEFNIMFNVGIDESEQLFDKLRISSDRKKLYCEYNEKKCHVVFKSGQWCKMIVIDCESEEVLLEETFRKKEFSKKIFNPYNNMILGLLEQACILRIGNDQDEEIQIDPESYMETQALADSILAD